MIYHITKLDYFRSVQSNILYKPESFDQDGFIHCSTKPQVIRVANSFFCNQIGLLLLEIDESKLPEKPVFENLEGGTELFPHIYGIIPLTSISRIANLTSYESGFVFPRKWNSTDDFVNMVK
jgi:uncharacterized protein (DUF952 family)